MVQFNLLPDVKINYIKAQRSKRMVMLSAVTVTALAVFIFVLLFLIVNVFQKKHISDLRKDVQTNTKELKDIPDLDKVLTVQNQLKALPGLHEDKPGASRLTDYLVQLTPAAAKISDVSVDFDGGTMTISGTADTLQTINTFVDVLKFTNYKDNDKTNPAFSSVVLSSFGLATNPQSSGRSTYTIKLNFDHAIFDNTKKIDLIVPNKISTRSITEKPTDLFEAKQAGGAAQ